MCPRCSDAGIIEPVSEPKTVDVTAPDPDQEPPEAFTGLEKLLHRDFEQDMRRRQAHTVHARTDTASTIERGAVDFHVMFTAEDGTCRACGVEFKTAGNKPSKIQREKIADMRLKNIPVIVAWTLKDAILFCKDALKLPNEQ